MKSITKIFFALLMTATIFSCSDNYVPEDEECDRLYFDDLPEVGFLAEYYSLQHEAVGPIESCDCAQLKAKQNFKITNLGNYIPQFMPMPMGCNALLDNCNTSYEEGIAIAKLALKNLKTHNDISSEEEQIMSNFFIEFFEEFEEVDFDNYRCLIKAAEKSGVNNAEYAGFHSTLFLDLFEGDYQSYEALYISGDNPEVRWGPIAKFFVEAIAWEALKKVAGTYYEVFTADSSCDSCYAEEVFDALFD